MVRWRSVLLLAMLLVLPTRIDTKSDDDDEDETDNTDDDSNDADGDDDEESDDSGTDKSDWDSGRSPAPSLIPTPKTIPMTRTTAKRPLECFVCAFKPDTPIKSCLDPAKYRVHTMTCHSVDDKCFTSVMSKGTSVEAVIRGCQSGCASTSETTCCELNRCNSQAFAMPIVAPRALAANKTTKSIPTSVLFFVTILLVLQTVVKVAFV